MFAQIIKFLIKIYQKTLSPDHGMVKVFYPNGCCRFYPSCSEYAYQAVDRYGATRGSWMGIKRIFRCNPWSSGGFDPVGSNQLKVESSKVKASV